MVGMFVNCDRWHTIVCLRRTSKNSLREMLVFGTEMSALKFEPFGDVMSILKDYRGQHIRLHNVPCLTKVMRMLESIEVMKPDLLPNHAYILVGQVVVFECKLISRDTTRENISLSRTKKCWAM